MSDPQDKLRDLLGTIHRQDAEIARLQTVLDAAREACLEVINAQRVMEEVRDTADDILRALDGEVKPCPTCGGSGKEKLVTGETRVGNAAIRQVDSVKCSTCGGSGEVKP